MVSQEVKGRVAGKSTSWVRYTLAILAFEKIVQHAFVTAAFYLNWGDINSTVAVAPAILMSLGAIVGVLWVVCLWGMIVQHRWAVTLAVGLALFDIVGEFVAQGKLSIAITVSFLVAGAILMLAFAYRRLSGTTA